MTPHDGYTERDLIESTTIVSAVKPVEFMF